jgi:AcrR family transcriptional regulator
MTRSADDSPDAQPARQQRANRRQEIIQTAFEVFTERGFRGASLEQVAQRVGLTKAGILHYFPSKEALLVAVLQERDRESASTGARWADPTDPLHARLAGLQEIVAQNTTRRGLVQAFTVLSAESVTDNHPAQDYFRQRYEDGRRRLAEVAKTAAPELSDTEALRAASLVLAVMDGLQLQWLLDPDQVDMPEAFSLFGRLFEHLGSTNT